MAKLTGQTIAASYDQLLIVGDADGITATAQAVESADTGGNASLLYLSTTDVYSPGTGGTSNTAFGKTAGDALASGGNYNAVFGEDAGTAITTGANNVAVGYQALATNILGTDNIAIGFQAMHDLDSGSTASNSDHNIAIGSQSMGGAWHNTASEKNICIGSETMAGVLRGAQENVVIGYQAGTALVGGADAAQGDSNVIIGSGAAPAITTAQQNVIIGAGAFQTANSSENFNVIIGFEAGKLRDGGDSAVAIGHSALATMVAVAGNTAVGYEAGKVTTGANNTYVGFKAGKGTSGAETNNSALGNEALTAITDGNHNVAIGSESGHDLTVGDENIFIGLHAGDKTTAVTRTVVIGAEAGGAVMTTACEGAIAIGYEAGSSLLSGAKNTFIGYEGGKSVTTAFENVFLGYQAGFTHVTGSRNIAIGPFAMGDTDAGSSSKDSSDNIFIGRYAGGGTWVDAVTSGNIGIGHSVMDAAMNQTENNTAMGHACLTSLLTGDNNTVYGATSGAAIAGGYRNTCIGQAAGDALVDGFNNLCLGAATDCSATDAENQIVIGYNLAGTADRRVHIGDVSNHLHTDFSSASWSATSDIRQKKNIKDDSLGLEFIKSLRTTTYNHKSPSEFPKEWDSYDIDNKKPMDGDKVFHSLIAQEVKQSLDDIDCKTFSGWSVGSDGRQRVAKGEFITPLIKAVQELSKQIEDLKKQINK